MKQNKNMSEGEAGIADIDAVRKYLQSAINVKESFMDVHVFLCEDGTLSINDAETDEQLAEFKIIKENNDEQSIIITK